MPINPERGSTSNRDSSPPNPSPSSRSSGQVGTLFEGADCHILAHVDDRLWPAMCLLVPKVAASRC